MPNSARQNRAEYKSPGTAGPEVDRYLSRDAYIGYFDGSTCVDYPSEVIFPNMPTDTDEGV